MCSDCPFKGLPYWTLLEMVHKYNEDKNKELENNESRDRADAGAEL